MMGTFTIPYITLGYALTRSRRGNWYQEFCKLYLRNWTNDITIK
uniref:Uncharacterized protein n=1 Tax=Anguilla anguilla TaxID=7936 RepID=A0A0E9VNR5_ANGAN